jgi:predicted RNA-binding protein YlxR (DUF448 family)
MAGTSVRPRRIPTRTCIACRTTRPKRELLRIVRAADGRVALDDSGRVAGRGAYVCRDEACVTRAFERGALARALETYIPADLREALATAANERIQGGEPSGQE